MRRQSNELVSPRGELGEGEEERAWEYRNATGARFFDELGILPSTLEHCLILPHVRAGKSIRLWRSDNPIGWRPKHQPLFRQAECAQQLTRSALTPLALKRRGRAQSRYCSFLSTDLGLTMYALFCDLKRIEYCKYLTSPGGVTGGDGYRHNRTGLDGTDDPHIHSFKHSRSADTEGDRDPASQSSTHDKREQHEWKVPTHATVSMR